MVSQKLPATKGFVLIRIFLLILLVAGVAVAAVSLKNHFLSRGNVAGDQIPKKPFRAAEYLTSALVSPKAYKNLKLDYVYRGNVNSASAVNKMLNEFRDYEIFGTKNMVHKRYIPHLNSVSRSGDGVLQAIHNWAVANKDNGGSESDPAPEYVVCFNEQNAGYSIGWSTDFLKQMLDTCIYTVRHPFGPDNSKNDKWTNVKIILSLGSQVDTSTVDAETSRLNKPWDVLYPGFDYHIINSPVTYQGIVVTSPTDNRLPETSKLVDGKADPLAGGTFWESLATTLPVSIDIRLNVDTRQLSSLVNRVRFFPKLSAGVTSAKIKVEVWAVNSANESEQKLVTTVSEAVTNGQMVERVFNPPISFGGTNATLCDKNVCPVSRIKLVVREWPGKVGFYEIQAERKAYPPEHRFSWAVVGLFPKWPLSVLGVLKTYNSQIYGYGIHYYPGYICRGWNPQAKATEAEYGFKTNDQSYIDCTRDYIREARRFLLNNGLGDKPLLITEWGDSAWSNPNASADNKKLSWRDPVRWYQFWNMLQSERIEMHTFYSPIWVRDGASFDPAIQCRPGNNDWNCSDPFNLGCKIAPGGLVEACDPVHPTTPSETLNPYGVAFAKLADINSGVLPTPPTVKNGNFEQDMKYWQLCGDKKTLDVRSATKSTFSFLRDISRQNPIAGVKSLTLSVSENERITGSIMAGVCQDTIWPRVDMQLRYLVQSKDNPKNGIIVSAKDSLGEVRIGLNKSGNLSKYAYDLQAVYPLRIKSNLSKKTKLSFDLGRFYFEKYNRGIEPTFKVAVGVVADGGIVTTQVDEIVSKSYAETAGQPTNSQALYILDEN